MAHLIRGDSYFKKFLFSALLCKKIFRVYRAKMTPKQAYYKACDSRKRLPELEHIIMTCPWFSYFYALKLIRGRWIEAEDVIMTNSADSFFYAKYVIKGRLPDKMHNMMILYAIKDPNNWRVKDYFEFIEFIERK